MSINETSLENLFNDLKEIYDPNQKWNKQCYVLNYEQVEALLEFSDDWEELMNKYRKATGG